MKRLRLILAATALLLTIVGCMCTGPPDPPRANCDDPEASTIEGLELRARYEVGGQGSSMLMMDVTYLGAGAPECAELNVTVVDPDTGNELRSREEAVLTNEIVGGRALRESYWMFWEFEERVEVTVEAYGQSQTALVCQGGCVADDAGAGDAG